MDAAVSTGDLGGAWGPRGTPGADPPLPTELLSSDRSAACSPRLSPDGQRLLYLEGSLGGPHRQCLRLCMVSGVLWALGTALPPGQDLAWNVTASHSVRPGWWVGLASNPPASVSLTAGSPQLTWQTRQTVTVLDVVQEPTECECSTAGRAGRYWGTRTSPWLVPMAPAHHLSCSQPLQGSTGRHCHYSAGQPTAGE